MRQFAHGPFTFDPGVTLRLAGTPSRRWTMRYGREELSERTLPDTAARADVIEAFGVDRGAFVRAASSTAKPPARQRHEVALVRSTPTTGEVGECLGRFFTSIEIPGMSRGMIDDQHETWAMTAFGSMPMTPDEFERLAVAHRAAEQALDDAEALRAPPTRAWIASLLPDDVLADDPEIWRAPTAWEIRHAVGEGSFTGLSGAKAAALVGVTPQNFRKYTAADGAATQQRMSYAMWHLLLHRLGIKQA